MKEVSVFDAVSEPVVSMEGSSSFTARFRGAYSDMHCCDHPAVPLDKLDAAEQVAAYKAAGVDNLAAVWAKCHWGYSYYPTKVGVAHPKLKGDYTGDMVKLLHKEGLQAFGYFSLGFDNIGVINHPEWGARDKSGKIYRVDMGNDKYRWYWACQAGPYRDYVLAHLRELTELYDFDGLFIDINEAHHGEGFCYCDSCREQIKTIYGVDIMREELPWEHVVDWWWNRIELQMMRDIRNVVKSVKPDMPISANADALLFGEEFRDLLDYTFRDTPVFPYGFEQSLNLRSWGLKYFQVGVAHYPETYDIANIDAPRAAIAGVLAQGGLPAFYFEAEKADGSFETQQLKTISPIFKEIAPKEPYLVDAEPIPGAAVYFSWNSKLRPGHAHHFMNDLTKASRGALSCLVPIHVPLDMLASYNATTEALSGYQVIVLPECTHMSDEEAERLRAFVRGGGILVATGRTGIFDDKFKARNNFALADVFGLDFVKLDETYANNGVGAWVRCGAPEVFGQLAGRLLKGGPTTVQVEPRSGKTLATFELPCLAETNDEFVCWGPAPPATPTDRPAVYVNDFGRGKCLYIAYDIFLEADKGAMWPASMLASVLDWLSPRYPISVEGDSRLKCSFMLQKSRKRVVVHVINPTAMDLKGSSMPLGPAAIRVNNGSFRVKRAEEVSPTRRDLLLESSGNDTIIRIDVRDVHHMVVLEKEG